MHQSESVTSNLAHGKIEGVTRTLAPDGVGTHRILAASLVGTAIEYFDFYIFGTAAALVFGSAFFPKDDPAVQQLQAFTTFVIAFLARPLGAALFGHFGDRIGRKATLVASLLIMGVSTFLIGCLPTYASIGWWAPAALCLLRFGQGIGFGGEWGGAVLLAVENAPPERRALYSTVPQIGAQIGYFLANLFFLGLALGLTPDEFQAWGWRLPFLASAVLVGFGLYVRLKLTETPAFVAAMVRAAPERVPFATLLSQYRWALLFGSLAPMVIYAIGFLFGVFAIGYATGSLGFARTTVLSLACIAILLAGPAMLASGLAADRFGRKPVLLCGMAATVGVAFLIGPLLGAGTWPSLLLIFSLAYVSLGWVAGTIGAALSELFPTRMRYTGTAVSFNLAGILGVAGAPYATQMLMAVGGVGYVGFYLAGIAVLGFVAVAMLPEPEGRRATP